MNSQPPYPRAVPSGDPTGAEGHPEISGLFGPPEFHELLDWLEGRLAEPDREALEERLVDAGPEVHATLAWLRSFLDTSRRLVGEAPPERLRGELDAQFAAWWAERHAPHLVEVGTLEPGPVEPGRVEPGPVEPGPVDWDALLAQVIFDSRTAGSLVGVRGGSSLDTAQIAFALGGADVVVDVAPVGPGVVLVEGQVLPADDTAGDVASVDEDVSAAEVELRGAVDGSRTATLDDLGRFRFDAVTGSRLSLWVWAGGRQWRLDLDLATDAA